MPSTVDINSVLRRQKRQGPPCSYSTMPAKAKAVADALISDVRVYSTTVSVILQEDHGVDIGRDTIQRHRRRVCRCFR